MICNTAILQVTQIKPKQDKRREEKDKKEIFKLKSRNRTDNTMVYNEKRTKDEQQFILYTKHNIET